MPLILLLETATDICSVGLCEGDNLLVLNESEKSFDHVAQITKLIDQCMQEAGKKINELDAIAVSNGPGSYTALRVGTATAKGICYALNIPLIAIDTLQALAWASAQEIEQKALYCPMIDARRMEVYTAVLDADQNYLQETEAHILSADSFQKWLTEGHQLVIGGNGAEKCKTILQKSNIIYTDTVCSARYLVSFANRAYATQNFEDLAYYAPLYFKPPNITTPKKNLL
jgi:tRNA threonylcarbamoyladenosine biosynthesis protein TsaB